MNLRLTFTLLLFACVGQSFAQSDYSMGDYTLDDSTQSKVGIWWENHFNSNVINNSMYYNQLFGTTLNRQAQENMTNRTFERNRAGNQETERLYYSWRSNKSLMDSSSLYLYLTAGVRRQVWSGFGGDVFLLTALGNKQFAGKTADLNYLDLELMQYMQIQFGGVMTTENWNVGASASLLLGNRYLEANSENSGLYTSPIGDTLYGYARGTIYSSDTTSNNIFDINGYGFSVDLYASRPLDLFKKQEGTGELRVELNDLGMLFWNDKTTQYSVDGEYTWTGIDAPNLFDISDSLFNDQVPDDLEGKFVQSKENTTRTSTIHPRLAVTHIEQLTDRLLIRNMIDYRFGVRQLPYLASSQFLRINDTPGKWNYYLNFYESLGGYGFLGLGLGVGLDHEKFNVILGTRNAVAMMSPDYLTGFNTHLGFYWKFR